MSILLSSTLSVKDTSLSPCPSGKTCQRVDGWVATLYDTIIDCCNDGAAMLPGSINHDYCRAVSAGAATGKWFRHDDANRCAKHCIAQAQGGECSTPSDPSVPHYDTALECCTAELWNLVDVASAEACAEISVNGAAVQEDAIAVLSEGEGSTSRGGTDEYYVDWIHQTCVKNCPEDERYSECGGISTSKWVELYDDVDDCCDNLHYIDRTDCVKGSS